MNGEAPISYAHHRFPSEVICHAVWLNVRFTLSYRDVEDLLTVRRWILKFGPAVAACGRVPALSVVEGPMATMRRAPVGVGRGFADPSTLPSAPASLAA